MPASENWLAPYHRLPPYLRGILLMILSGLMFACMQAMIRLCAQTGMHPLETAFYRSVIGFFFFAAFAGRAGLGVLKTKRLGAHFTRSILQAASLVFGFAAVTMTPLASYTALTFTAPLFAAIGAAVILHEKVDIRRWLAIAGGFGGCLIVLDPGQTEIGLGPIFAIVSSLAWAMCMVGIKDLSRTDSSLTQGAYMSIFVTPMALLPALFFWQWPDWEQVGLLTILGILGSLGHLAFSESMRQADATAVMPFEFLRLLWATIIGYSLFAEQPDVFTWIGGAVIFASATFVALAEARRKSSQDDGAAPS